MKRVVLTAVFAAAWGLFSYGQKLRVRSIGHAGDTMDTDYTGNAVWRDGRLSRLLVDGGYIEDGEYRFFVTDHLGSVRGVTDSEGHLLFRTHYYPYGSEYGYEAGGTSGSGAGQGAGLETSAVVDHPYRYNGKEDQGFAGVPVLDYGSRLYFVETGRWLSQDPLGEEYYWVSPYAYCAGNPVDFVDPEGMDIWEINSTGYVVNRIEDKEQDSFYIVDKNSDGEWERTGESISFDEIIIEDEGSGFDYCLAMIGLTESQDNIYKDSGRGIFLISLYTDDFYYEDDGRKIVMIKYRD